MPELSDDDTAAGEGFACWFCPTCQTLTLLSAALANRCCHVNSLSIGAAHLWERQRAVRTQCRYCAATPNPDKTEVSAWQQWRCLHCGMWNIASLPPAKEGVEA